MIDYLITNLIISGIALTAIYILNEAPARLRFYFAIFAVIGWFVPWNAVATLAVLSNSISPFINEVSSNVLFLDYNLTVLTSHRSALQATNLTDGTSNLWSSTSFCWVFFALQIIGLLMFMKTIVSYYCQIKTWKRHSTLVNHYWLDYGFSHQSIDIRITKSCSLAMATGLFKPTIWLNEEQTKPQQNQLKTILTHELTHIKQHDPKWMWLLTLARCLFWWNPICLHLNSIARNHIELSCDEQCKAQLKEQYSQDLALIMLNNSRDAHYSIPAVMINNSRNFNMTRIKNLTKESQMKTKYVLATIVALVMSTMTVASIADKTVEQNKQQSATPKNKKDPKIYNDNAHHNQLVDQLLAITKNAKSQDPNTLNTIQKNLLEWVDKRPRISDQNSEHALKLKSFTILSYVLDKLEKHQEILNSFELIYQNTDMDRFLYLKNHLSIAHINNGEAQKAIDIMQGVISRQPEPKVASLLILAYAYLANNDNKSAIDVSVQVEAFTNNRFIKMRTLNIKRAAFEKIGKTELANKIVQTLKSDYDAESQTPQVMRMASPMLAYLPEAS